MNRAASLAWNEQETSTGFNTNFTAKKDIETSQVSRRPSMSAVFEDALRGHMPLEMGREPVVERVEKYTGPTSQAETTT